MRKVLLSVWFLVSAVAAQAQTAMPVTPGYMSTTCPGVGPCFVPTGDRPPISGFGTLAVTSASALVSTLTVGPNSAVWPTSPGFMEFRNTGASVIYLCPLGGTCSATVGIPIAAGAVVPIFHPTTTATVFDATTGTLVVNW